jgi:hypothetical protein
MNKHVKLLGALFIIWGAMGLVALLTLIILAIIGTGLLAFEDARAGLIMGSLGLIVIFVAAIASLPNIFAGLGLIRYQNWGRVLAIVLSFLNLFAFPLGSAMGIYGLWVLFQPEVVQAFRPQGHSQAQPGYES